jgi:hypothetical protein
MSSLQQNWRRGLNRFCLDARGLGKEGGGMQQGGEMAQIIYAHMNKLINKPKFKKPILHVLGYLAPPMRENSLSAWDARDRSMGMENY